MKLVPLREGPPVNSAEVIRTIMANPQQGASVDDMRRRCRVLDALDSATVSGGKPVAGASLLLEDADHEALANATRGFLFGTVSRELLRVVDDILDAKAPPTKEHEVAKAA